MAAVFLILRPAARPGDRLNEVTRRLEGTILSASPWKAQHGMFFRASASFGLPPPHTGAIAANRLG
jgi:hypothetical protein